MKALSDFVTNSKLQLSYMDRVCAVVSLWFISIWPAYIQTLECTKQMFGLSDFFLFGVSLKLEQNLGV